MPDMGIEDIRELFRLRPRPSGFPERRKRLDAMGAVPLAQDITLETETIGSLTAEWSLAEGSDPSKTLLYFHGGGYCSGSISSHRYMVVEAGRAAGVRTLAVNYRVAPEHPFPSALEDAQSAYAFLIERGFAAQNIAVGGDSAGGGLALALLTLLRDAGSPMPSCGWLVSPWVDLQMTGGTIASKADVDPMIQKDYLDELAAAYVGGADPANPLISPLRADLRGLPPLLVQVGSDETLLDDSVRIAGRAGAAEVAVTLEIWPHMIHVWHLWASVLADARLALDSAGTFIRAKV